MFKKMISIWISCKDGVAAVEFALIVPILMFIMVGAIDYGMYAYRTMQVDNLTDASITYMMRAVINDESVLDAPELLKEELMEDVTAFSSVPVTADDVTISEGLPICECGDGTAVDCDGDCGEGDYVHRYVEVGISLMHETFFGYPGIPDSFSISRTLRMQVP